MKVILDLVAAAIVVGIALTLLVCLGWLVVEIGVPIWACVRVWKLVEAQDGE